ncbi:MAG: (2Fe-2S)-binding protein [Alphaproteobacteria bacterium]|nr:MAG: (2Fe-2S)-binding protein [Alphaproteobacteria bacterium]
MYVCICNGLTEARVREAARESGERHSAKAVYRHLGCEARCGLCLPHARRLIAEDGDAAFNAGALAARA